MNRTKAKLLLLLATGVVVKTAWGQDAAKQQPPSASEGPAKICEPPRENLPREHRFWDKENRWLFAAIEAAATGVSIGASYLFHRYRHHKLERWTSLVHCGLATGGAISNYCLKTAHPRITP